jgi:hypothetical protein
MTTKYLYDGSDNGCHDSNQETEQNYVNLQSRFCVTHPGFEPKQRA